MKPHHQAMAFMLIIMIIAVAYVQGPQMMESFKGNGNCKCNPMFNGSYPSAPVVCLAGNSKIPCTAFSSG